MRTQVIEDKSDPEKVGSHINLVSRTIDKIATRSVAAVLKIGATCWL
jgi:hypothetical protein